MTGWMLDTNAVSDLLRGNNDFRQRLAATTVGKVYLSPVTVGELHYGLTRRPDKTALQEAVRQLLLRVRIPPWTEDVAASYGQLHARLETTGTPLAALDLMIAAHALHLGLTLTSNDRAFRQVSGLAIKDWRQ